MVYAISLLLIGLSGLMLDMHRRSWRAAREDQTLSERDLRFAQAQYRRRNQASGMIGVLGAAIGVSEGIAVILHEAEHLPTLPGKLVLFAVGVMTYELLALSHPFDGSTSQEVVNNIMTREPDMSRLDILTSGDLRRAQRSPRTHLMGAAPAATRARRARPRTRRHRPPPGRGSPRRSRCRAR